MSLFSLTHIVHLNEYWWVAESCCDLALIHAVLWHQCFIFLYLYLLFKYDTENWKAVFILNSNFKNMHIFVVFDVVAKGTLQYCLGCCTFFVWNIPLTVLSRVIVPFAFGSLKEVDIPENHYSEVLPDKLASPASAQHSASVCECVGQSLEASLVKVISLWSSHKLMHTHSYTDQTSMFETELMIIC